MAVTAAATAARSGARRDAPSGPIWVLRDIWTEALRHLRIVPRNPDLILFASIQPVMFVLLFNYVFGGSIEIRVSTAMSSTSCPGCSPKPSCSVRASPASVSLTTCRRASWSDSGRSR